MPALDLPPRSVEALTDKELEILRLLTAGHTVKSIAVRLGRSEASINERLRDARRKTGIGSSRALARHLAAQKIWDKKIDLSAPGSTLDEAVQPPMLQRLTSKGSIIMLIAIALAAAGIVVTAAGPTRQAAAVQAGQAVADRLPLAGKWSLDTSRLPAEERPSSVTLEFGVSDARIWTGRSEIVAADGTRQHAQNTLVLTFTKGGVPVSTRVYTVEDDGKAMKETIVWAGDVTPRMVTTYFDRVD